MWRKGSHFLLQRAPSVKEHLWNWSSTYSSSTGACQWQHRWAAAQIGLTDGPEVCVCVWMCVCVYYGGTSYNNIHMKNEGFPTVKYSLLINNLLLTLLCSSITLCSVLTHFLFIPVYLSPCLSGRHYLQPSTKLLIACKQWFHSKIMNRADTIPRSAAMTLMYWLWSAS